VGESSWRFKSSHPHSQVAGIACDGNLLRLDGDEQERVDEAAARLASKVVEGVDMESTAMADRRVHSSVDAANGAHQPASAQPFTEFLRPARH
jgi:hypothetical protein